jgi:hypothetical protein
MELPLKLISSNSCIATVPPAKVSDGMLRQPLLLEKGDASINHLCTSVRHISVKLIWLYIDYIYILLLSIRERYLCVVFLHTRVSLRACHKL